MISLQPWHLSIIFLSVCIWRLFAFMKSRNW